MIKEFAVLILVILLGSIAYGQVESSDAEKDSLFILEFEDQKEPVKVLHAEPLYIDLIRDLGARKGEKEWNLGLGLTSNQTSDAPGYSRRSIDRHCNRNTRCQRKSKTKYVPQDYLGTWGLKVNS